MVEQVADQVVEEDDQHCSHVKEEERVRVAESVKLVCVSIFKWHIWEDVREEVISRQEIKRRNDYHVVVQYEGIAGELDIDQWRVDNDLEVVDHSPKLIE